MILFNSDLDNTIIFSYRHEIGPKKVDVELYQGRNISFVTEKTYKLLKKIQKQMLFVPTTTRTVEQYQRINLGIGIPQYALVCNGGILLVDGVEDQTWYRTSLDLIRSAREELEKAYKLLEKEKRRSFELRMIRDLFLFTKCEEPELVAAALSEKLDSRFVDVWNIGTKVYVIPKELQKGNAIIRFRQQLGAKTVIAAGDSGFDVSMLNAADIALAPETLNGWNGLSEKTIFFGGEEVFSDQLLAYVLKLCSSEK